MQKTHCNIHNGFITHTAQRTTPVTRQRFVCKANSTLLSDRYRIRAESTPCYYRVHCGSFSQQSAGFTAAGLNEELLQHCPLLTIIITCYNKHICRTKIMVKSYISLRQPPVILKSPSRFQTTGLNFGQISALNVRQFTC